MGMGEGSSSSHQASSVEFSWTPATPAKPGSSDRKVNFGDENPPERISIQETGRMSEENQIQSKSSRTGDLGSKSQHNYIDAAAVYDGLVMDNLELWNSIPCRELLALADAAVATKDYSTGGSSGGGSGGGGGGGQERSFRPNFSTRDCSTMPDTEQYRPPSGMAYSFDLNLLPTTTCSSQFTPVTPDQGRSSGQGQMASDTVNREEQPQLIVDLSHNDVSALISGNPNAEKGLIEETNLNKASQLKPRRRKHRPKVVIEGERKVSKSPATPKADGNSSRPKRKYVRKKQVEKPAAVEIVEEVSENNDQSTVRETRSSCRRKINFDEELSCAQEQNLYMGVQSTLQPGQGGENREMMVEMTQVEPTFDKPCPTNDVVEIHSLVVEGQAPNPVTPNKTEIPNKRPTNDSKHAPTRAKCSINFSEETHDKYASAMASPNESNCSTSACLNKGECSSDVSGTIGVRDPHLEAYLSRFTDYSSMHFPSIFKKRRTEKYYSSVKHTSVSSVWSAQDYNRGLPTMPNVYKAPESATSLKDNQQYSYGHNLAFVHAENCRRKRTKGLTRMRDSASFARIMESNHWLSHKLASGYEASHQDYACMEALATDFRVSIATKKRTKRNYVGSSYLYHNHHYLTNQMGFHPGSIRNSMDGIDALAKQFERLDINGRMSEQDRQELIPYLTRYQEKNALVLYQRDGTLVPFEGLFNPERRRKPRPKVDLDDETTRVWRLLLENINSQGIDGTDEEKAKWWEEERKVFRGRADSFIARMHLVQGDRRFSRWKGSVVDSVIGVFLTQNVSDHLSSSAFMSLAARYPLGTKRSNEPLQEEKQSISVQEPCHEDLNKPIDWHEKSNHPARDHLHDAGSCEQNEVENIKKFSKDSVTSDWLNDRPDCEVQEISENMESVADTSYTRVESFALKEERNFFQKTFQDKCSSEQSGLSEESTSQTIVQLTTIKNSKEASKSCTILQTEGQVIQNNDTCRNNCEVEEVLETTNLSAEISEVTESNNFQENSRTAAHKIVESNLKDHENLQQTVDVMDEGRSKAKRGRNGKTRESYVEWDSLRKLAEVDGKRERRPEAVDSLDYEAVRCADVKEIADTIKERGMNNMLAERIKDFLNRLVRDHGSIDLEWLRDVPPDQAKEYLLSFRGLGLKSVECVRLLTLHHLAFPVDTNVGRIAVRLGWVPLQPLPESLQLHLLELYPVLESIQKYLWPRLCKLDQRTLYELHYQMITFGKVFCTKSKPNCNACPMRGECRHFASAFASARLALPAPEEKSIVNAVESKAYDPNLYQQPQALTGQLLEIQSSVQKNDSVTEEAPSLEPIVEVPATPEPTVDLPETPETEHIQQEAFDIEDFCEDPEEIPTIKLNMEEFTQNLQTYMAKNMELGEGEMSKALVALTSEAASIPTPKLKNVSQLRTEHHVYELPDSHPLLEGLDKREPDDPCSYLLAIWTPGETADSIKPSGTQCSSQETGSLCNEETCFSCNSIREANSQTVRGTLLIPCRTAMRGSFPLNGTYFQVNEVFADHESSLNPIKVPRSWLWNLPRRTVYFGTSIPTIFKGLTTESIQVCFWKGFVCVRGFDQKTRAPRPLMARLHFPASKLKRTRGNTDEK